MANSKWHMMFVLTVYACMLEHLYIIVICTENLNNLDHQILKQHNFLSM
jgi:hypothetical protein